LLSDRLSFVVAAARGSVSAAFPAGLGERPKVAAGGPGAGPTSALSPGLDASELLGTLTLKRCLPVDDT
jgi:hypothetical protein